MQPLLRARVGRQSDAAHLEVAIREAVGKRGVSVLVLPGDVALQPASNAPPAKVGGLLPPAPVVTPARHDLERLAALLNGDGRVSILCGSGCQGAHDPPNGGRLVRRRGMRRDVSAMREWPATKDRVRAGEWPQIIGTKVLPPRCVGLIDAPPA